MLTFEYYVSLTPEQVRAKILNEAEEVTLASLVYSALESDRHKRFVCRFGAQTFSIWHKLRFVKNHSYLPYPPYRHPIPILEGKIVGIPQKCVVSGSVPNSWQAPINVDTSTAAGIVVFLLIGSLLMSFLQFSSAKSWLEALASGVSIVASGWFIYLIFPAVFDEPSTPRPPDKNSPETQELLDLMHRLFGALD